MKAVILKRNSTKKSKTIILQRTALKLLEGEYNKCKEELRVTHEEKVRLKTERNDMKKLDGVGPVDNRPSTD